MEHVVFFPSPDGSPAFRRVSGLEEAVRLVEHLRNVEGVGEVSVHALTEVPLAFRAYYRVEVPGADAPAPDLVLPTGPAVSAPAPDLAPVGAVAPVALAPEPLPAPEPVAVEPAHEPAAAPEPVAALVPEQAPEPAPEPAHAHGRRSLGFFAS